MTDTDPHQLASLYAIEALDGTELNEFEAHYATCETCRAEVAGVQDSIAGFGHAMTVAPPSDLKAMVMAEISETPQSETRSGNNVVDFASASQRLRMPGTRTVMAAAAIAVLLVGLTGVLLRSSGTSVDDVVAAPDSVEATLSGDEGNIRAIWSVERGQVALVADGLVDAGVGNIYELWFVLDDGVARAGLFEPDDSMSVRVVLDVEDVKASGFGVTIEPTGGSVQPTSEILFVGEVAG